MYSLFSFQIWFSLFNLSSWPLYLFSLYIALSSSQLFSFWVSLELNLMLFLLLMYLSQGNQLSLNVKYFLIQSIGSALLLLSLFAVKLASSTTLLFLLAGSLLLKMGAAPFQSWVLVLSEGLTWQNFLILSTLQKLAPLYLFLQANWFFSQSLIILGVFISSSLAWSELNFKKLLGLSSVFMLSWLFSSSFSFSLSYLMIYGVSFYLLSSFFFNLRLFVLSINSDKASLGGFSSTLSLLMLNFAGAPPLALFFCKILILTHLLSFQPILSIFLIGGSGIFVWVYTRLMVSLLGVSSSGFMWSSNADFKSMFLGLLMMLGFVPLLIYMYELFSVSFWS